MRKFASLTLVAAGVLITERVILRLYNIWWIRGYPINDPISGHQPHFYVVDGFGRELTPTPEHFGWVFGRQYYWAGWSNSLVDAWFILAASLVAYLLLRGGILLCEKRREVKTA